MSLLRLQIWEFLTIWWSKTFFGFPLSFKIISFQVFGKATIICNQYILWVSLRWNSSFISFQGFIFPLSLNNWPIKFKFLSEKREKCTGLLSTLIFELKQMTSSKIMDGRVDFKQRHLKILLKYPDKKMGILKECHCLYKY